MNDAGPGEATSPASASPPGEPEPAFPDPVELSDEEAGAVVAAALAFADAVPPGRDAPFRELAADARGGVVPPERMTDLERICVLALETGKARRLGGAETERLLTAVYRRTPGGRELASSVADVNRVLSRLAGRDLQSMRLSWRTPGRYTLSLSVSGIDITLALEPEGPRVQSVQTG
ncbi:hypothetical protein [Sphaerimonospora mesophila]|uniref:hypothetical protein n=1 Tax=Sphaerimonospora mesophila TaxID=37483 RepID=UPI0006E18507